MAGEKIRDKRHGAMLCSSGLSRRRDRQTGGHRSSGVEACELRLDLGEDWQRRKGVEPSLHGAKEPPLNLLGFHYFKQRVEPIH